MKSAPHILLVDSNPDEVRLVREVVESAGLGFHIRSDQVSAIEACRALQPDLVLIEAQSAATGLIEVSRELQKTERGRTTPIVLITGEPAPPSAPAGGRGASHQLLKPLGAQALLSTLAHYFPSAFLPTPASSVPIPSMPGSLDGAPAETGGGSPSAEGGPFTEPIEEQALGVLLDLVFPAGDSGDLARNITGVRSSHARPDSTVHVSAPALDRGVPSDPSPLEFSPAPPEGPSSTLAASVAWSADLAALARPSADALEAPLHPDPVPAWTGPHDTSHYWVAEPSSPPRPEPAFSLDPPPRHQNSPVAPAAIPYSSRPSEIARVARGDFAPSTIAEPEVPPVLSVQPPADAVNPRLEAQAHSRALRYPEAAAYNLPSRHAPKRPIPSWALIGVGAAVLVGGTTIMVLQMLNEDSDLQPVLRTPVRATSAAGSRAPSSPDGASATSPLAGLAGEEPSSESSHTLPARPVTTDSDGIQGRLGSSSAPPADSAPARNAVTAAPPTVSAERARLAPSAAVVKRAAAVSTPVPPTAPAETPVETEPRRAGSSEPTRAPAQTAPPEAAKVPIGEGSATKPAGTLPPHPESPEPVRSRPGSAAGDATKPGSDGGAGTKTGRGSSTPEELRVPPLEQPFLSPVATSRPQPHYPSSAKNLKLAGTVKLLVKVSENGSVASVHVVGSVAPALDQAAVSSALAWKYRPAQYGDKTVSAWVEESVVFKP